MNLKVLDCELSVCKVQNIQSIDFNNDFVFVGKTDEELSLVCDIKNVPEETICREDGWKGFRIEGQLDFSLIGILSKISTILAENEIGIYVVSTFNTDYILIKKDNLEKTKVVLGNEGYIFI